MIKLMRCDDRLIHGQFMTVVSREYDADNVIVIDDFTASNEILKSVFATAVPKSMKSGVYTKQNSIEQVRKALTDSTNTIVLMKEPAVFLFLLEHLPDLPKSLNIGPMSSRKGTLSVSHSTHLLSKEVEDIKELVSRGIDVYFRQVPSEKMTKWEDVKNIIK